MNRLIAYLTAFVSALFCSAAVFAQSDGTMTTMQIALPDSGDTSWLLTASALVLLMGLPGFALFYGGRVRAKNVLSVMIQCGAIAALSSVLWIVLGYSLVYSVDGSDIIGSASNFMFSDMLAVRADQSTGELVFGLYQMMFAIVAPIIMVGAWAERARFGWVMAFTTLWTLVVYIPVARWAWGGGFLADMGLIDFGGGLVIMTTAGVSALVIALMMGRRTGWPENPILPHSPALTLGGALLLWVGWFGFTGGSALGATDVGAGTAILNTHLAASSAALLWLLLERFGTGRTTAIGFASGVVSGLAAITPAAGSVGPLGALIIGMSASAVCFFAVGVIHRKLLIDDSLDTFAVFGVGGITGSILVAIFSAQALGGVGYAEGSGIGSQLLIQLAAVGITVLWSIFATVILGYMVSLLLPMRVSPDAEREGLDIASHGQRLD